MKTLLSAAALIVAMLCSNNVIAQKSKPEPLTPQEPGAADPVAPPSNARRPGSRSTQAKTPVTSEQHVFEQEAARFAPTTTRPNSQPYQTRLQNIVSRAQPNTKASASPLIIRFGTADAKLAETLEEDLGVMSLLLEKSVERAVGQSGPDYKMGIPILTRSDGQSTRVLYLDGFGALFFLSVNIPLVAPPAPPAEEVKEQKPAVDSDWENAKRELYNQAPNADVGSGSVPWRMTPEMMQRYFPGGLFPPAAMANSALFSSDPNGLNQAAPTDYNAEQVESLKQELARALKNATNIRSLKADEFVAITVFGAETLLRRGVVYANYPKGSTGQLPGDVIGKGSTLTLRAKKSDIDSFAKETMNFEEFQKRATIHVHAGGTVRSATGGPTNVRY